MWIMWITSCITPFYAKKAGRDLWISRRQAGDNRGRRISVGGCQAPAEGAGAALPAVGKRNG